MDITTPITILCASCSVKSSYANTFLLKNLFSIKEFLIILLSTIWRHIEIQNFVDFVILYWCPKYRVHIKRCNER